MGFQGVLFNNAITLEEIYNLTPSCLAPRDHNSIVPLTCWKEGQTAKVLLSCKGLKGVILIKWNHDC